MQISNKAISTERFWQVAILVAAGTLGVTSEADAALYYWGDSYPGYYRPAPMFQPRRPRIRRPSGKPQTPEKDTAAKPQGPLIIAVSIERQRVRIFDANGFFAEAPVSTGMSGHPTPTGVFSVIQKHKFHHSNIYSGAPMPFMQRITWSGVAMHAGVLPGYPASHGCIRMPMSFAVKMWNWTKMGARVFVTPYEIMTPVSFSHPLLATMKVPPQPVAAEEPATGKPVAAKTDKGAPEAKPENSEAKLELRSTVGHADVATPANEQPSDPASPREQTRTADAGGNARGDIAPVTMSDAPSGNNAPPPRGEAIVPASTTVPATADEAKKPDEANATRQEKVVANNPEAKSELKSELNPEAEAEANSEVKPFEVKPPEPKQTETAVAETKPAEAAPMATVEQPRIEPKIEPKLEPKVEEAAELKPAGKPVEAKVELAELPSVKADPTAKADVAKTVSNLTDAKAAMAADAKKDQTRLGNDKAVAKPEPKHTGQIAVFISRKDSRLYVRENFKPWFSVPVTIAPSDRPFGTHVFTAEVDKNDSNLLHWSVVSLPLSARSNQRSENDKPVSRHRKAIATRAADIKPPPVLASNSAAEALDRLTVPADAMARVNEALSTGGSIVISDQGINQGETGEGTDFIVSLR